jgi:uncharacterized protein (TIGR02271 family)
MSATRNTDDLSNTANLREGLEVYSGEGRPLGSIERVDRDAITVRGERYELTSIERVEGGRVYLTRQVGATAGPTPAGAGGGAVRDEGEVRVPVQGERLEVETRPADVGEVRVRKTVEEEQQTVPVELTHEEVRVERREVRERPLGPGERAFEEGTIRVPVRGEEAVARKEAVVTGEVVIDKELTTERQEVTGTVRRERVEVDEDTQRAPAGIQPQAAAAAAETAAGTRPSPQGPPRVDAGAAARGAAVAAGADVVGSDGERVGRVKGVRGSDFLLDRPGRRDVYVPFAAVAQVTGGRVVLAVGSHEVDEQGWPNPPLF